MAKLYGIGVGPGDKELLTVKAVRIIQSCDVIVAPSAEESGESIALETARAYIRPETDIVVKHFPMGKKERVIKALEAYEVIENKLKEGKNVAFLTIGDPYIYSTYSHMLNHMKDDGFEVETIPGITSFCAAASLVDKTLVVGNESLVVMPASKVKEITDEKFIVIMKIYKKEKEVLDVLDEKGFHYVYASRVGRKGQLVLYDRDEILKVCDYMSLIIASR